MRTTQKTRWIAGLGYLLLAGFVVLGLSADAGTGDIPSGIEWPGDGVPFGIDSGRPAEVELSRAIGVEGGRPIGVELSRAVGIEFGVPIGAQIGAQAGVSRTDARSGVVLGVDRIVAPRANDPGSIDFGAERITPPRINLFGTVVGAENAAPSDDGGVLGVDWVAPPEDGPALGIEQFVNPE